MCVFKNHAFIYFLRPPSWSGTRISTVNSCWISIEQDPYAKEQELYICHSGYTPGFLRNRTRISVTRVIQHPVTWPYNIYTRQLGWTTFNRFTYIRSKDGRSKDKRSNDQRSKDKRSKDKRSKDKRSNDKRSNDKRSKDKRSKSTEGRMTERRIGPNVENDQNFYTIINF